MNGDPASVRRVELAVLASIVKRLPELLTEDEITKSLSEVDRTPQREAEVRRALQGVVDAGFAEREGPRLVPTTATHRLAEMEVEL